MDGQYFCIFPEQICSEINVSCKIAAVIPILSVVAAI